MFVGQRSVEPAQRMETRKGEKKPDDRGERRARTIRSETFKGFRP